MDRHHSTRPGEILRGYLQAQEKGDCETCLNNLYLFVSDEEAGYSVDKLYPDIAYHLDHCPTCLAYYEELAHLFYQAIQG